MCSIDATRFQCEQAEAAIGDVRSGRIAVEARAWHRRATAPATADTSSANTSPRLATSSRRRPYAITAWAIALGIFEMSLAFALPLSGGRSLLLTLGGLLSVAFGVAMFAHPGAGTVALLALVAAFALVTGAMQIAFALELRRSVVGLDHRVRPHATAKPVTHG